MKIAVILIVLSLALAFPGRTSALVMCPDEQVLLTEADVVVEGEVQKSEPASQAVSRFNRLRLATIKVDKIIKGDNVPAEIIVEYEDLDKTLEPDVQDAQLDSLGEKGTAFLKKLPDNNYQIIQGICGWSRVLNSRLNLFTGEKFDISDPDLYLFKKH